LRIVRLLAADSAKPSEHDVRQIAAVTNGKAPQDGDAGAAAASPKPSSDRDDESPRLWLPLSTIVTVFDEAATEITKLIFVGHLVRQFWRYSIRNITSSEVKFRYLSGSAVLVGGLALFLILLFTVR